MTSPSEPRRAAVVGTGLIAVLLYLRKRDEVPMAGRLYLTEIGVGLAVVCSGVNYWVFTPRLKAIQGQLAERFGNPRIGHLLDLAAPAP